MRSSKEMAKLLLEHEPTLDLNGKTKALHVAVGKGDEVMAQLLLDHGADVNKRNRDGEAALLLAVKIATDSNIDETTRVKCKFQIIPLLLKYGATINNHGGMTELHYAVKDNNEALVRRLIEKSVIKDQHGNTFLDYAPALNFKDLNGETVLHYAAAHGNVSMLRILLESGADVNSTDNNENTALFKTCQNMPFKTYYHEEAAQLLLEYGADLDRLHLGF